MPFRPNPLTPFPAREGGKFGGVIGSAYEWDPRHWQTLSPRGRAMGVEGAQPPPRGFGRCAPKNIKIGGELPTLATPPRVGPKTLANTKSTGVGKQGVRGVRPPGGGSWGGVPHKTLKRGEQPTPATQPRVGPKTLANPQPTRVGKRGSRGAPPPWRGVVGGVPPQNIKRGASCPH